MNKKQLITTTSNDEDNIEDVRPDFEGFTAMLRAEAKWSAMIHSSDTTGQAESDQRRLNELADRVEKDGDELGFTGSKRAR